MWLGSNGKAYLADGLHCQQPTQRPIKNGLHRIVWNAQRQTSMQISIGYCTHLSVSVSILGLCVGQCEWTIINKRMHSSRMRTIRSSSCLPGGRCLPRGGVCQGGVRLGGSASQHALRQTPPCGQNSWQTLVKILPCRNLVADGKYQLSTKI